LGELDLSDKKKNEWTNKNNLLVLFHIMK
jgi:hypothetical protein